MVEMIFIIFTGCVFCYLIYANTHFSLPKKIVLMDLDGTLFPWNQGADYTREGYFEGLQAISSMKSLADLLRSDDAYIFRFCTAYINERAKEEKFRCLQRYWPDLKPDEVIFVPFGESKFDYIPELGDSSTDICLIDDYSANLHDAEKHGVVGIKARNGINGTKGSWRGKYISVFESPYTNYGIIQNAMR